MDSINYKDYSILYITFPNEISAKECVKSLLTKKLIACANIFPQVSSLYLWKDKLMDEKEVTVILKSKSSLCEEIIESVKKLHPYECPCILAFPINKGNPNFLSWIHDSTL